MEVLQTLNYELTKLGIHYEFMRMTTEPLKYPYWVGEYTEVETFSEDGKEETMIILTGYTRGTFLELEEQKERIKNHFKHGIVADTNTDVVVVLCYSYGFPIPQEDASLKRYQINLISKLWRGE